MPRAARPGPASAAASWARVSRCQPKAAPLHLSHRARQLVGRVEAGPDDEDFFRWSARIQPSPGTSDAAVVH